MKTTQPIQKTIFIATLLFLTGCSSMNAKFDCPNKPGVTCRSIGQVNAMVDRGVLGREEAPTQGGRSNQSYLAANALSNSNHFNNLRSGEEVVRVWVAPYQDVNGNYHNASSFYTVVRNNNWEVPREVKE